GPCRLEYAGDGLLRARIFPIPAQGEVLVKVRLRQVLQPLGGIYEWRWPVRAAAFGDAGSAPTSLDLQIHSTGALRTVVTPHPLAGIARTGEHDAHVSLDAAVPTEDLRVLFGLAEAEFGLHLLTWRKAGEPGYFAMLLSPRREPPPSEVPPPRLVQVLLDTSGSMQSPKLEQARVALRAFVQGLKPIDRFQIATFDTEVKSVFPAPRPAGADAVAEGLRFIDALHASGGTNIAGALEAAFGAVTPADAEAALAQIVF